MSYQNKTVPLLRELLSVLRTLTGNSTNKSSAYKHTYGYSYIASIYRNNKNVCNENTTRDLQFLAETYLCLLKSIRDSKVLYHRYKGGGERSVEEIANLIGFKLPSGPKL